MDTLSEKSKFSEYQNCKLKENIWTQIVPIIRAFLRKDIFSFGFPHQIFLRIFDSDIRHFSFPLNWNRILTDNISIACPTEERHLLQVKTGRVQKFLTWMDCSSSRVQCYSTWGCRLVCRQVGALCAYSTAFCCILECLACFKDWCLQPQLLRSLNG